MNQEDPEHKCRVCGSTTVINLAANLCPKHTGGWLS